jgi:hypothetical protein
MRLLWLPVFMNERVILEVKNLVFALLKIAVDGPLEH